MLEATLNFQDRNQANEFAKAWSRKSLMGHTVSKDNSVSIYGITDDLKLWIDNYVDACNKG